MVKISLDDRKSVVIVAALLSGALAFLILRALLTNHGVIEAIDIQWNQNLAMFEYFFHTWNFYNNGSNIIFASQFPIYGWVLVFKDVELAQRFVYFLTVSLISFNMFIVAFYTLKKTVQKTAPVYLGSIVASLIYSLNPLIFSEIFHISFLWAYSLFPLVFYFGWETFNTSSRRKVLVCALSLSIFFAFMADAWGMLVGLIMLVIVAISSAILNGRKNLVHRFVPNFFLTLLIMGVSTVLLAAYWLLPYITQRSSGPAWDPFSLANLVSNSQYSGLTNIFGLHSWSVQPFYPSTLASQNQLLGGYFFIGWQFLTLILPIIAVSTVLMRRNKFTLSLSGLLLIGIFLATGVKYLPNFWPPIGEFYKWLTFYSPRIIPNQSFLLKYPYLFLAIACLAVALLSAFLVADVFRKVNNNLTLKQFTVKSYTLPIVLFFSIISLIALVGAPLLTGNLNGALSPVTLPEQYKELNNFFSNQKGSFRVMYVPQEANFNWSTNPWANKIEYWGSGATPLMYGWGISASPNTGFLGNLVYDYLLTNQTQYLGKLLALGNVRFIVFHNDSKDGYPAFDLYFKQYKDYFNSFLSTTDYNNYFLSLNDNGTTRDDGYLNFILKEEYLKNNYVNSSDYQNLLKNPEVDAQYKHSSFYKNLPYVRAYLNDSLNSLEYQSYLNNFSIEYQNFVDSPSYNSSHNYLDSSEYLILSGSQYFANSTENKNFINSTEYRGFLDYYFIYTSNSHFNDLLNVMSPADAKTIYEKYGGTYQNFENSVDYTKYQSYLNYVLSNHQIFNNLQSQKDLKLVTIPNVDYNENLFIYENTELMNYFQAYSKENLLVGGLDAFGRLSSIPDLYLNESAFVFAENQPLSFSQLSSILNSSDIRKNVVFYNDKTKDDLVLDTLDSGALIDPGDNFVNTSQNGWLKDSVTSYSWTPISLGNYVGIDAGGKYDFGLGHSLLYTTSNQNLSFSFNANKVGDYDFWARLLFSPAGGNLGVSIVGRGSIGSVNTNTNQLIGIKTFTSSVTLPYEDTTTSTSTVTNNLNPQTKIVNDTTIVSTITGTKTTHSTTVSYTIKSILDGFKWVHLGNITLDAGTYNINFENENGALNAVNMVALPTINELENHEQNVLGLINQSDARIVYLADKTFLGTFMFGDNLSVPFNALKKSLFSINLESSQQLNEINLTVDNRELKATRSTAFTGDENWFSTCLIDLSQGSHNITISNSSSQSIEKIILYSSNSTNNSAESIQKILGGGAEPFVVSFEKTDPVSFSVVVNSSKPFILGYQEPYDDLWQSNSSTSKIMLNSVNNGFLIENNAAASTADTYTIYVTYTPEKYLDLGLKVSALALIFVTLTIVLILLSPKIHKKKWR
jgi:hypothetical protein